MALYELFSAKGDEGMLVGGVVVDAIFRDQADDAGQPEERLLTITDPEALLEADALKIAARGLRNRLDSLTDSDQ